MALVELLYGLVELLYVRGIRNRHPRSRLALVQWLLKSWNVSPGCNLTGKCCQLDEQVGHLIREIACCQKRC